MADFQAFTVALLTDNMDGTYTVFIVSNSGDLVNGEEFSEVGAGINNLFVVGEQLDQNGFNGPGADVTYLGTHAGGIVTQSGASVPTLYLPDLNSTAVTAGDTFTINPVNTIPCFGEGTLIAGPAGETKVEDLEVGDLVRTADGRDVPVKWIGYDTLFPSKITPKMQPVRIREGAFGQNLPHTDLIVTADHAMEIQGYLVNASALVNGDTIDYLPLSECDFSMRVYHVELEAHEVLLANGAPSESYLDIPGREAFSNYQSYSDLYGPETPITEMAVPRIPSARLLPAHIRSLIATDAPAEPLAKLA